MPLWRVRQVVHFYCLAYNCCSKTSLLCGILYPDTLWLRTVSEREGIQ